MRVGVVCINLNGICGLTEELFFRLFGELSHFLSTNNRVNDIRDALRFVFGSSDGVCVVYEKQSWSNLQKAMLMEFERSSVFVEDTKPYVVAKGFKSVMEGIYFDRVYEKPFAFIDNETAENLDISILSELFGSNRRRIGIFDRIADRKEIVYTNEFESILVADARDVHRVTAGIEPRKIYTTKGASPQEALFDVLRERNIRIAAAESCTAGLITGTIAHVPGVSSYLEGGCVTYSNQMKMRFVGVNSTSLQRHGAVSEEVAIQMAIGVLSNTNADFSVAVTGIAGPTGGTKEKPVGLVYIAVASHGASEVRRMVFSGNRRIVRTKTVRFAILYLRDFILRQ